MIGEDRARRRREFVERLNSEKQPISREAIEERERRAEREERARSEERALLRPAAFSSCIVVFSLVAGVEAYIWLPAPIGLWTGALSVYAAFRYLGWGRPVASSVWAVSFTGWLLMSLAPYFPAGASVLPRPADFPAPTYNAYEAIEWLLTGAWVIAGVTTKRLSYEERRP